MTMRRFISPIAAAALTLTMIAAAAAPAGASPAAAHKTYTSATYGYTINYPGNWTRSTSKTVQFIAYSPDKNAFLTANAVKGTLALSDIKTEQKAAIGRLGTIQGKVTAAVKSINSIPFELSEALVKTASGKVLDVILVDTDQHATLYDFNAGVVTGAANTANEIKALQNALNSIVIKGS